MKLVVVGSVRVRSGQVGGLGLGTATQTWHGTRVVWWCVGVVTSDRCNWCVSLLVTVGCWCRCCLVALLAFRGEACSGGCLQWLLTLAVVLTT